MTAPATLTRVVRRFAWNEQAQRYVDASGRFVSTKRVRLAVDQAIRGEQAEIRAATLQLRSGAITVDEWYMRMRAAVKDVELFSAAAARGGWAQMSASDYGRVGAAVKKQYAYLDRFAGSIEAGLETSGPGFLRRAMSYANAGRGLYHEMHSDAMAAAGMTEERNRLRPADHCAGCVVEAARGWVPLGDLVPIGERDCLGNCECFIEYR